MSIASQALPRGTPTLAASQAIVTLQLPKTCFRGLFQGTREQGLAMQSSEMPRQCLRTPGDQVLGQSVGAARVGAGGGGEVERTLFPQETD